VCFLVASFFFFSSRRRHTRLVSDWSSDVCSSDLKHRMVGLIGLQKAYPAAVFAPGAADHLVEQLERALGRARIPVGKADVGIDRSEERRVGKEGRCRWAA